MLPSPNTPSDTQASTVAGSYPAEAIPTRQPAIIPRYWIQTGFFSALGVAVLAFGALLTWKLGSAILDMVTPFAVALVLALLLDPLADRLEQRGMSRGMAAGLIFGTLLLILVCVGILIVPPLVAQASQLSHDAPRLVDDGREYAQKFLTTHHQIGPFQLPSNVQELFQQFSDKASEMVQHVAGRAAGILLGSVSAIIDIFVTLIVTLYLLMDIDRLRARCYYFAPERARAPMAQYAGDVGSVFSNYLRGLLIVCALYGFATLLIFYGLGFVHPEMRHYALLLGVSAGLLFAVPYVGTITTALVAGVVALVAGGAEFGAIAVTIIIIMNQLFDHIISPRVVGGGVGLHPVLTVFALVLGGELFGLPGLLLSVPLAASLQVILFRLFPKLASPTPESFLQAQGVRVGEARKH